MKIIMSIAKSVLKTNWHWAVCLICIFLEIFSYQRHYNTFFLGIILAWGASIIYCLKKFRQNFIFILFQISMFTFLISRNAINLFRGEKWWNIEFQASDNVWFAMLIVALAENALFAGAVFADKLGEKILSRRKGLTEKNKQKGDDFLYLLRIVSLGIFSVCMFFYLAEQFEPLVVLGRDNYLEYYSGFESSLPGIIHTIASFQKYSLAIFLSTLPEKRVAFVPLALYVLSTIPSLLVGVRNPLVLAVLFILTYYVLRDYLVDSKKWIGKIEKILLCVFIPIGMIFMGLYSYIRSGVDASAGIGNPFQMIADFFYGQGVTFDFLCVGFGYRKGLEIIKPVSYTFGSIIDYLYRGTLGQIVFGTEPLTSYNSDFNAVNSNSLSHALSKLYLKDQYLEGRGVGSCFSLENYIDFGYAGVVIFAFVLGMLLIFMVIFFGRKTLLSTIILTGLMNIYFMPRAESTSWISFVVTIQFWACVAGCYIVAYFAGRLDILNKIKKR